MDMKGRSLKQAAVALSTEGWYSNRRADKMIEAAALWAEPRRVILAICRVVEDALQCDLERVKEALSRFPFEDFAGDGPVEIGVRVPVLNLLHYVESGEDARAVCLREAAKWCWDDVSEGEIATCCARCEGLYDSFEYASSHVGVTRDYATIRASSMLAAAARDVAKSILCYLNAERNAKYSSYHRGHAGEFASRALSEVAWVDCYRGPRGGGELADKAVRNKAFDRMSVVVRDFIPYPLHP